jgi:hypothetical protein
MVGEEHDEAADAGGYPTTHGRFTVRQPDKVRLELGRNRFPKIDCDIGYAARKQDRDTISVQLSVFDPGRECRAGPAIERRVLENRLE